MSTRRPSGKRATCCQLRPGKHTDDAVAKDGLHRPRAGQPDRNPPRRGSASYTPVLRPSCAAATEPVTCTPTAREAPAPIKARVGDQRRRQSDKRQDRPRARTGLSGRITDPGIEPCCRLTSLHPGYSGGRFRISSGSELVRHADRRRLRRQQQGDNPALIVNLNQRRRTRRQARRCKSGPI
jgi:hypothetical protein